MWFIGVEVEQETSAPPPKKNPGSAPAVNQKDLGTKLSCFGCCEKKNGRTVGSTFYLSHYQLLSKNMARRQLNGQYLLLGVYLQTCTALYFLNMHY